MDGQPPFKEGNVESLRSVLHNGKFSGVSADSKSKKDEGKRSRTAPSKPSGTLKKSYVQSMDGNLVSKQSKTHQSVPSGSVSECSEWSMDGQPTFKEGTVKGLQSVFNKKESSGVSADSKSKTDEGKRSGTAPSKPSGTLKKNYVQSIGGNPDFKLSKTPQSVPSGSVSECSESSMDGQPTFKELGTAPSTRFQSIDGNPASKQSYLKFQAPKRIEVMQTQKLINVCDKAEGNSFYRSTQMQICCLNATERQNSAQSETVVPPPGKIEFQSVTTDSVILSWGVPKGLKGPKIFRVKWTKGEWIHGRELEGYSVVKDAHQFEINDLERGQRYIFSVATDNDGNLSEWIENFVFTAVPAPRLLTKTHSEASAVTLKWTKGENMEGIKHQFIIALKSQGKEPLAIQTKECFKTISNLEPGTEYTIEVSTMLIDRCSEPVSTTILTEACFRKVLSKMGLEDYYDDKLTLSTVLEINQSDTSESKLESPKSYPEAFLRKLMMLNANARSVKWVFKDVDTDKQNTINPLDLITALFLCSDGFLQQDMVVKMALCQFAVPLLMPNHDTREITMMLWAMREIVRTFSPSKLAFRNLSCEERLVLTDIPLLSFVRLGRTSLSKSQVLNKLLSNTKECYDIFYNRNMEGGDVPRKISEGLVEMTWYLPCGKKNTDKFTEPLAVANLRGDIRDFDKQFSFLCQTSAAVYIFCDESEIDYFKHLEGMVVEARLLLISSIQGKSFTFKTMAITPSLKTTTVSQRKYTESELVKALQESVSKILGNCPVKVSLANLADTARRCDILVDEDIDECQGVRKNADNIIQHIADPSKFKEKQLPSQGHIWKELSLLETEYWRLRNAGNENIEDYRKLKNVGKKPLCHFVHTNMSESPDVERKKRGKELVKQLNEVIRKDTRMRKANITKCSDVMEFDRDTFSWYMPPVWNGTPPMAPFSVDYSETAHALKKRLIGDLKKCQGRGDLMQFISDVDRFWKGL
ncbi:hypothetical protein CgunFtcFv8_022591 [Champsocephalus gunnari]|uniref:Uncharacterized protein n=1 Tax=Champsocephalus gunnari TaxID=52237 RepID=A0AAN8HST7_CHAGU|nr:hypothetical protein CgunFtcFv8_022591 [Champsocephalus gunnari]